MSQEIMTNIVDHLKQEDLSAVVVASPDNVTYTAGFEVPSQIVPISRERLVFCIITASGDGLMLVPDMEYTLAESNSNLPDVKAYNEFTEDPIEILSDILEQFGVAKGKIALEDDFIPGLYLSPLINKLGEKHIAPAKSFMEKVRALKTDKELETLQRLGKIAEGAHHKVARETQTGMNELEIANLLYSSVFSQGAQRVNHLVVGSGERSGFWNANPTKRCIKDGDVIRIDIFAKIDGYQSDVARTWTVGDPSQQDLDVWHKLIDARALVLDQIKPGQRTGPIYQSYRDFFENVGLEAVNFVGHGIGITLHESPYISRYHDEILLPGMVLCIEPLTSINGTGYQVEDEIIVTEEGYELITDKFDPPPLIKAGA